MKNKSRLIELLEHKRKVNLNTAISLLGVVFEVASYDVLISDDKKWFQEQRTNCKIIDFYLSYYEYQKDQNLNKFKNIHTLDNVIELKELLKLFYFSVNINDKVKVSIVYILTKFITEDDKQFYFNILQEVFEIPDYGTSIGLIESCGNALEYIYDITKPMIDKDNFWIKGDGTLDSDSAIMFNSASFFGKSNVISEYESLKYMRELKDIKYLNKYKCNEFEYYDVKDRQSIEYSLDFENKKLTIDMIVLLGDKIRIDEKKFDILSFIVTINRLLKTYQCRNLEENYTISFDDKDGTPLIIFKLIAVKKDADHYVIIKSRNGVASQKRFETLEIIAMFRRLFLHISLYIDLKYDIELNKLLDVPKKDFLEFINPIVVG